MEQVKVVKKHRGNWWPGVELNHRHEDFQSSALPTELPGRVGQNFMKALH